MDVEAIRKRTLEVLGEPIAAPAGVLTLEGDEKPAIDRIVAALAQKAAEGDTAAAKLILEFARVQDR